MKIDLSKSIENVFENKAVKRFLEASKFQPKNESLATAQKAVLHFVADMYSNYNLETNKGRWLTLMGKSGVGKTMLAKEVYNFAERFFSHNENKPVGHQIQEIQFYTIDQIVNAWKRNPTGKLEYARQAWLLIIDDMGREYDSDFTKNRLGELLDYRLGKFTLITSNLTKKDMSEKYDGRITSRIKRDGNKYYTIKSDDFWK